MGNFPVDWSEWNGRFRDAMRRFGKGDAGTLREVGWRITGSADLYGEDGRSADNSVNFVTCHDGFTLHDLYAYDGKHNEANGEDNRDGTNDNASWNCGAEGPTNDPGIVGLRRRLAKNQVCFLLFSCGTPMLLGGDEFLRTQRGNNNGYCQDNELAWFDWDYAAANSDFTEFTRKAIAMTRRFPILQRRRFLTGRDEEGDSFTDIAWFGADGDGVRWDDPEARMLCFVLETPLAFIYNCDHKLRRAVLPPPAAGRRWRRIIDTSLPAGQDFAEPGREVPLDPQDFYLANSRSVVVLLGD